MHDVTEHAEDSEHHTLQYHVVIHTFIHSLNTFIQEGSGAYSQEQLPVRGLARVPVRVPVWQLMHAVCMALKSH